MATNSVPAPTATPRLTIPDVGSVETEGAIEFSIPTSKGLITVTSWARRYWACRGTSAALAEYGLLRNEWLPGLPGNSKVRQTVMFTSDGPQLRIGKRGGARLGDNHISIVRISSQTYEIEIPMTAEQSERSEQAWYRHEQQEEQAQHDKQQQEESRARAERDKAWAVQLTPMELRAQMKGQHDMSEKLLFDSLTGTRFRFSAEAERAIHDCYTRLRHLVASGVMRNEAGEKEITNVVPLRCRGALNPTIKVAP